MRFRSLRSIATVIGLATGIHSSLFAQPPASSSKTSSVPFIGCKSDGQIGPREAPTGTNQTIPIPTATAQKLAYYKAEDGLGVLAPIGWYCFGTYGSNGSSLFVSPQQLDSKNLFSTNWKGFTGPVIQLATEFGDTSGRFGVASIIARVFPAYKAFVRKVIAGGFASASDFPFGPYPTDKLVYKSKGIVEYQTPAEKDGLGTQSRLMKNSSPISGVEILAGETPDLISLASRLSPDMTDLTSIIIQQVERDGAKPNP
jgi:hypothetical protein